MAVKKKSESLSRAKQIQNYIIPIGLMFIISILVLPIPAALLDVCIALNISISLVVLFVALYMEKTIHFSSFPAVLLITTMFRLAMNVAATRMILLYGDKGMGAAGEVIQAFGEFVVGGSYVVGVVIFIIISLVNLKVITKGSSRIAEVAARFTLDAMPGKQMAIDSDLNTGLIKEEEAKLRRKELAQEAEFYGAMDGAAKFVGGDAIAGLFITAINIFGGFFIGVFQKDMPWMEAASVYTILTIGDGLVSQIPAIIVSTAAGLIVARAASGDNLGTEVINQLGSSAKPLFLTSAICAGFAIVPGLPFLPFMILGLGAGSLAMVRRKAALQVVRDAKIKTLSGEEEDPSKPAAPKPGSTEEVTGLLGVDTLELEVGYELVSLVEGGDLVERIRSLRRQFALDYGFIVPPIHIRDNVRIKPAQYRVMLRGAEIGTAELQPHHLLAMDPGTVSAPLDGTPTKEPAFGLDALWIRDTDKERAQFSGYTVVDLSTVATTHITELIKANMHELVGRQEVQYLLDNISKTSPKIVEELVPDLLSLGQVQQVLACLLREKISIRDLKTILETLADWAATTKHPEKLAEYVRRRLARLITEQFITEGGVLPLASINPTLEKDLSNAVQQTDEGSFLALDPGKAQQLINRLQKLSEKFIEIGQTPVILAPGHLRAALSRFVERFVPGYAVMSHHEVAPNTKVQSLGVLTIE